MHEHAGSQTKPHTPLSAFILSAEQNLHSALTESCLEHGRDHEISNGLRDMMYAAYELRLKVIGS